MVSETILYGAGAILASEATGVTNFTSVGGDTGTDDPNDNPAGDTPGLGGLTTAIENVRSQTGQMGEAMAGLQENQARIQEQISRTQDLATAMSGQGGDTTEITTGFSAGQVQEFIDNKTPDTNTNGNNNPVDVNSLVETIMNQTAGNNNDSPNQEREEKAGESGEPKRYGSAAEALLNPGHYLSDQNEAAPEILGTPGEGAKDSGGLFGKVYDMGQATGDGFNEVNRWYDEANNEYREATKGAREGVEKAKDVTRPWRWLDNESGSEKDTGDSATREHTPGSLDSEPREMDKPNPISLPDSVKQKEEAAVKKINEGNADQIGGL